MLNALIRTVLLGGLLIAAQAAPSHADDIHPEFSGVRDYSIQDQGRSIVIKKGVGGRTIRFVGRPEGDRAAFCSNRILHHTLLLSWMDLGPDEPPTIEPFGELVKLLAAGNGKTGEAYFYFDRCSAQNDDGTVTGLLCSGTRYSDGSINLHTCTYGEEADDTERKAVHETVRGEVGNDDDDIPRFIVGYASYNVIDTGIVDIEWDDEGTRSFGIADLHNHGPKCADAVWSIKRAHTEDADPASRRNIGNINQLAHDLMDRERNGSIYAKFVDCGGDPDGKLLGLLLIDFEGRADNGPNGWDETYYVTEH